MAPKLGLFSAYLIHVIAAMTILYLFAYQPERVYGALKSVLLIFFPFVLISLTQIAVWLASDSAVPTSEIRRAATAVDSESTPARRRMVWVVFDELDADMAFSPQNPISLPHFDQLKKDGFSYLHVSPSALKTIMAIPEMTTGRRVPHAEPADANASNRRIGNSLDGRTDNL